MKQLSVQYVDFLCAKFERIVNKSIESGRFNRTVRFLKALSYVRYKFFIGCKNDFIENQIQNLALHIDKRPFKENDNQKTIVIVDEINADYIGLMVQYIASFISGSYLILYLYEHKEHSTSVRSILMQTLQSYDNAQIKQIPSSLKGISKSQWIYNEICDFGSKKVLMHFGEWAIEGCVACASLPIECVRYRINVADHCFWAGVSCTDYSFEFRHYGANLSYKERGLKQEQIVYIPFYPVMKDVPFAGFPKEISGKFVFFSGGAIYKIVDDDNTFFKLCKSILDECPNSVILFAGSDEGNAVLSSGIDQFGLHGRLIPIGYRKDILEVFKHCDVYLDTYPIGGGLMCQYAAQCSKPIINYKNCDLEECIAQKADCKFTFYSESDLLHEAVKLYSDTEYRKDRGAVIHNAVITKNEFDKTVLSFMSFNKPVFEVKWNDNFVPRDLKIEDAIAYNNKKLAAFYYKLFKLLYCDFIWTMPRNFFSLGLYSVKRQIKKIIKK